MTCPASFTQNAFRGRNDDGSETTASWKEAQNVNWVQLADTNFRVRFQIQEGAACAGNNIVWRLQYNKNAAGWVDCSASSSVIRASASPNLADAANLTDQLTGGTGTFQGATGFDEGDCNSGGGSMDVVASGHAETEFCVQLRSADTVEGDSIQLRITNAGTAIASYTQTPTITRCINNYVPPSKPSLWFRIGKRGPPILVQQQCFQIEAAIVTPSTAALTLTTYAPTVSLSALVTPPTVALTITTFAPQVNLKVIPPTVALTTTAYAPVINLGVIPGTLALTTATFAPQVNLKVIPPTLALTISTFAPQVNLKVIPPTVALTVSTFAPQVNLKVIPGTMALTIATYAPTVSVGGGGGGPLVTPPTVALALAAYAPRVRVGTSIWIRGHVEIYPPA